MAMENSPSFKTGEQPGKGIYQCVKCGKFAIMNTPADALPDCPKCKVPSDFFKKT